MRIPVVIHFLSGDAFACSILFTKEGPLLGSECNIDTRIREDDIQFTFVEPNALNLNLAPTDKIELNSLKVIRGYAPDSLSLQEMYPPSSNSWITHLSESGKDAIFSLQSIIGKNQYLLSIVDVRTEEIINLLQVNSFEVNLLLMETDWDRYNRIITEIATDVKELSLEEILGQPAPSWKELSRITEGIDIPHLDNGETIRDTMEQLVPKSFPENVRLELMAFLAYIIHLKIPKDDPLDFQISLRKRFQSSPLLRILVYGHIQCLVEGISPPQYVRLMVLADRGMLGTGMEPSPVERDPWGMMWYRLMEMLPTHKARVASIADELNRTQKIITSLPVSKGESKSSTEAWLDRFSLVRHSLVLRGYIQDQRIGLVKLAFIGNTHRWPHKHLAWSARLGNPETNPPFIQIMLMPPAAAERIIRIKPKISCIDWSASRINYNLYNPENERWRINLQQIFKSFSGIKSMKQVENEFNVRKTGKIHTPTYEEAIVLDLLSWGMYLQSLEVGNYDQILNISRNNLAKKLSYFKDQGIIQLQYLSYFAGLVSVCLEVTGDIPHLYSAARAFLKYLPSATVMVSEGTRVCYVLARVPESSAYDLLVDLPGKSKKSNLAFKGFRMTAYVGYIHNLYQRLLKDDGTWDDDISGLLSQIRF
jgi:hypothetical protein